jgi:hypothetical protein
MRTRDETRAALVANFKRLMDCVGQLTEDELTSCPVAGTWTVKDVIAHIWTWSDEAARTIKAWQAPRPWQVGVSFDDAWNNAQAASKTGLPLLTVMDGVLGAHRRLVYILDTDDDAALARVGRAPWGDEMPLVDFLYEMAEHYSAHIGDLSNYQVHCLQSDH